MKRNTSMTAAGIARLLAVFALALLVVGALSSTAGAQLPGSRPRAAQPQVRPEAPQPPDTQEPRHGHFVGDAVDTEGEDWDDDHPGLGPCMDELQLTEQQQERVEELHAQARREMIRARGDLAKARADLHAEASDPQAARSAIEQAAHELQQARTDLHERMLKAHLDVREQLTAEQREELSECRMHAPRHARIGRAQALHRLGPRIRRHLEREAIRRHAPGAGVRGGARGWGSGWRHGRGHGWY